MKEELDKGDCTTQEAHKRAMKRLYAHFDDNHKDVNYTGTRSIVDKLKDNYLK